MSDQLLDNLVKTYRNLPTGAVLTVHFGNSSVTGQVVSSDEFLSSVKTYSEEELSNLADDAKVINHTNAENVYELQKQRTQIDHEGYIHLQEQNGTIWRIAVTNVIAWAKR